MPLPTHLLTCLAAENRLKPDPLCKPLVKERTGYSQIIFRKPSETEGLNLTGFDWYVRKGSFGLSIQSPFDAQLARDTLTILFPAGITVIDGDGNQHLGRWHDTDWSGHPAVQLIFERTEQGQNFPQTEFGEYQRALFRGFMLEQLIAQTLPVVKSLVAAKIASKTGASTA
ncbi:MAG TPA: hypothetical protein VED40_11370 [Azospirillaceae bacterium]|nr:hypothetical protein [Azospirillaceae bacterium]